MSDDTIDTAMAKRMLEAGVDLGASIVGQPGGWSVMLRLGKIEKSLVSQRTDQPRLWRSLDRCVAYLKSELSIARVEMLDASNHSGLALGATSRLDTAERMRHAHQAAAHDRWFRSQVEQAMTEADDPNTEWVSDEDAKAGWAKKRAQLLKRSESGLV